MESSSMTWVEVLSPFPYSKKTSIGVAEIPTWGWKWMHDSLSLPGWKKKKKNMGENVSLFPIAHHCTRST